MSSKPATSPGHLLDELQAALAHGTVARRVETLRRVTDLFINGAVDYSDEQIGLFDDVFQCLIVASSIENGELVCDFKRATAVADRAALDFWRDENAPVAFLPRA